MSIFSRKERVILYPIIAIGIFAFLLYLPDLFGYPLISMVDKTNFILTFAIAVFALIQAFSALLQIRMEDRKNKIENARNELEKAYGQVYTILSKNPEKEEKIIKQGSDEKLKLDLIMSTYPFMFPQKIIDYWKNNIQNLNSKTDVETPLNSFFNSNTVNSHFFDIFEIPLEFINLFRDEYKRKIENLNTLLQE